MAVHDVNVQQYSGNAVNITCNAFRISHSCEVTNAACKFDDPVMYFDANRVVVDVQLALELHNHIMLK